MIHISKPDLVKFKGRLPNDYMDIFLNSLGQIQGRSPNEMFFYISKGDAFHREFALLGSKVFLLKAVPILRRKTIK